MNKILILVDCQYGFLEGGNLPVEGATHKMDRLAEFIRENGPAYDKIFLTADWHPHTHCSFKANGGTWPEHCVQHTHDAAIYQPIIDALNAINSDYIVLTKGVDEDHEEYSVFKNEKSNALLTNICEMMKVTDIDICGIALDVCVFDSLKDGLRVFPNTNFHLLIDFCPAITKDGEEKVINFINNSERINIG